MLSVGDVNLRMTLFFQHKRNNACYADCNTYNLNRVWRPEVVSR